MAKKAQRLGLRTISMGCGALALAISTPKEAVLQCALYVVRLNGTGITSRIVSLTFEGYKNEVRRNDKKLCFS
ncbi:DUF3693 domain-containing protein [Vibrio sp. RM-69-4]|uniref:DUF3693 domain-containing protein n=1 Tax=Vibrio sp. RM-69-4 TaxID=2950157 RepID=UPI00215C0109|nr:DUF3693 domain-containing protein [Vibrio sp. RM-69-4]